MTKNDFDLMDQVYLIINNALILIDHLYTNINC